MQTIADTDEMTPVQQIELMAALWKCMSERNLNSEPPEWHLKYLEERERAITENQDSFISLDEFEEILRSELKLTQGSLPKP